MAKEEIEGQQVITMTVPEGAPGVDADLHNPLSRAGRKRLEHGSGAREPLMIVLLRDPADGPMRWFGVFTESEAGQVIFFPGTSMQYDRVASEGAGWCEAQLTVDHLSLSADLTRTHLTEHAPKKKQHQGWAPTLPLGEGRVLWFGMTIPTVHSLRIVRTETDAWAQIPKSLKAAHLRGQAFVDALNSAEKPTLTMRGAAPFPKSLLHFCVVVLPGSAAMYEGSEIAIPTRWDGFVSPLPRNGKLLPVARGVMRLSSRLRLQLFTAWIPGEMRARHRPVHGPAAGQGRRPLTTGVTAGASSTQGVGSRPAAESPPSQALGEYRARPLAPLVLLVVGGDDAAHVAGPVDDDARRVLHVLDVKPDAAHLLPSPRDHHLLRERLLRHGPPPRPPPDERAPWRPRA